MTTPVRWVDDTSDATKLEKDLVRAGQAPVLAKDDKQALWAIIAAKAAGSGGAGDSGSSGTQTGSGSPGTSAVGAATASSQMSSLLWFVLGAMLGGLAIGSHSILFRTRHPDPRAEIACTTNRAPSPNPVASVASAPAQPSEAVTNTKRVTLPSSIASVSKLDDPPIITAPSAAASSPDEPTIPTPEVTAPTPQERITRLREESALVRQARDVLRGGDPSRALQILAETNRRFPDSVLGQEREALTIEALSYSDRAAASKRASEFLRTHPNSAHARDVQPFVRH